MISVSDDAAGILAEMQQSHGVRPEDVIALAAECAMESALNDKCVYDGYVDDASDVAGATAEQWQGAFDVGE